VRQWSGTFAAVIALAISVACYAGAPGVDTGSFDPAGLTEAQAKELLNLVLHHERLVASGVTVDFERLLGDDGHDLHPAYFTFGVSTDDPRSAATSVVGLIAIGRMTGDVWELNLCRRYSFPELRRIQKAITQRTRKTIAAEKEQRRGLGCPER